MKLESMKNIGKVLADDLRAINILTPDDLVKIGSIEALIKLGYEGPTCSNKLYALEGAIQNIRWHDLDKGHREHLLKTYKERRATCN